MASVCDHTPRPRLNKLWLQRGTGSCDPGRLPHADVHVVGHNEVDLSVEAVAVALAVGALDRNEFLEGLQEAIESASRATPAQLGHACSVLLYLAEVSIQVIL